MRRARCSAFNSTLDPRSSILNPASNHPRRPSPSAHGSTRHWLVVYRSRDSFAAAGSQTGAGKYRHIDCAGTIWLARSSMGIVTARGGWRIVAGQFYGAGIFLELEWRAMQFGCFGSKPALTSTLVWRGHAQHFCCVCSHWRTAAAGLFLADSACRLALFGADICCCGIVVRNSEWIDRGAFSG